MFETVPQNKFFDPRPWQKPHLDEHESGESLYRKPRGTRPQQEPELPPKASKEAVGPELHRPELQLGALLRAAWAVAEKEDLTKHANALADELGVSPEELYSSALIEFIERYENERLTRELNEVYGDGMEPEEKEFVQHVKEYHRRRLSTE